MYFVGISHNEGIDVIDIDSVKIKSPPKMEVWVSVDDCMDTVY